jgi:hypothetical protein
MVEIKTTETGAFLQACKRRGTRQAGGQNVVESQPQAMAANYNEAGACIVKCVEMDMDMDMDMDTGGTWEL